MDVAKILELTTPQLVYRRLDLSEMTYRSRATVGLNPGRDVILISESGLYKLVLRSDKPQAKPFQAV